MKAAIWTIVLMLIVMFNMAYDLREAKKEINLLRTTNEIVPVARNYIYVGGERQRERWAKVCK